MPKEVVYGSQLPYSDDDPRRSIVEVRWGRDGEYVELASLIVNAADLSPAPLDGVGPEEGPFVVHGGTWLGLDRRAINDLIRNLRRARDQAFGRDE